MLYPPIPALRDHPPLHLRSRLRYLSGYAMTASDWCTAPTPTSFPDSSAAILQPEKRRTPQSSSHRFDGSAVVFSPHPGDNRAEYSDILKFT